MTKLCNDNNMLIFLIIHCQASAKSFVLWQGGKVNTSPGAYISM